MPTSDLTTTADELVERVSALVPLLRANGPETDAQRQPVEENIRAIQQTGAFRMAVPRRRGGLELDVTTQLKVISEVSRGCGATGFVTSVYVGGAWTAALFDEQTQDEVFTHPDVKVPGAFSPGGQAVRTDGGYRLTGRWPFCSGIGHGDWASLTAATEDDTGAPNMGFFMVPRAELTVLDDWHTSGLRGSGSNSVTAEDVFVPAHRLLWIPNMLSGQHPTRNDGHLYRVPAVQIILAGIMGPPLGMAKAALELFLTRAPEKAITYTSYARQSDAPITHLRAGEAAMKIRAAELLALDAVGEIDERARSGQPWNVDERSGLRATAGTVIDLCSQAVDLMWAGSGASAILLDVPIQRIARDIQALRLHAMLVPSTNYELHGRVLCGLEPDTPFM